MPTVAFSLLATMSDIRIASGLAPSTQFTGWTKPNHSSVRMSNYLRRSVLEPGLVRLQEITTFAGISARQQAFAWRTLFRFRVNVLPQ